MNSDLSESYSDIKSSASSPMLHTKFLRFMRRLKVCTPVKRVWRRFSRFWRRICWTETMLRIKDRTETQVSQWTFKERPVFSEAQTSKRPHYKWKVPTAQQMNNWCLSKSERLNLNLMDCLSDRKILWYLLLLNPLINRVGSRLVRSEQTDRAGALGV